MTTGRSPGCPAPADPPLPWWRNPLRDRRDGHPGRFDDAESDKVLARMRHLDAIDRSTVELHSRRNRLAHR